jgi:hypothetical protein
MHLDGAAPRFLLGISSRRRDEARQARRIAQRFNAGCWDKGGASPARGKERSVVPGGTRGILGAPFPALKRWAIAGIRSCLHRKGLEGGQSRLFTLQFINDRWDAQHFQILTLGLIFLTDWIGAPPLRGYNTQACFIICSAVEIGAKRYSCMIRSNSDV